MGFYSKIITDMCKKNSKNSDRRIEDYVQACEDLYNLCIYVHPDRDPHEHLLMVLWTILASDGVFIDTEIDKPTQAQEIIAYTLYPTCNNYEKETTQQHEIINICMAS